VGTLRVPSPASSNRRVFAGQLRHAERACYDYGDFAVPLSSDAIADGSDGIIRKLLRVCAMRETGDSSRPHHAEDP
jgi:hypothetical protein